MGRGDELNHVPGSDLRGLKCRAIAEVRAIATGENMCCRGKCGIEKQGGWSELTFKS